MKEPWYDSDNPSRVARGASWRGAIWIVGFVVFLGLLGGGIWAFKVITSDIKGAGDQTVIVNDGRNRVNAQEWFVGQYQQIKAADAKLDEAKANLDANLGKTDEAFWRTNYSGLKNRCIQMVAEYNAETQKISRGKWLDPNLPFAIDGTDPTTDCKENAR